MFDLNIIFLGAIQGLTEFLPVSSSGHLAFFQMLFGFSDQNMFGYDIVLHMATLLAPLFFFRRDIISFTVEWVNGLFKPEYRMSTGWNYGWAILCGTVVTALIALPLKSFVEKAMSSPISVAAGLFFTSLILWYMEGVRHQERQISLKSGFLVGFIQGIAVMPGISRSGSTIFMGRLSGLSPEEAFRFSFLLSLPAILGATLLETIDIIRLEEITLPPYWWVGALLAFSLGMASLIILRKFVISGRWKIFSVYCAFLAFVIIATHVYE